MQLTSFQTPQLRDGNDNIIQQGSFGKSTAFSNAQNTGWIDYVMNNLQALQNNKANSTDLSNYLRTSGGNLTGQITFTSRNAMRRDIDNDYLQINGADTYAKGAYLVLYGQNHDSNSGRFSLTARNESGGYVLLGRPTGELTWGNKNIDVIESQGTGTTGYIRCSSGLQIVWSGMVNSSANATITFPLPFKENTTPSVTITSRANSSATSNKYVLAGNPTNTNFTVFDNTLYFGYIAIGWWK